MRHAALAGLSVAVVLLLAVPAVTGTDGFPVSSHPMYAAARPAVASFVTARGVDPSGGPVGLSMAVIADTDDPLVADARMRTAERSGTLSSVCAEIAGRVDDDAVTALEVVRVRHDVARYAAGDRAGAEIVVLTSCAVP